MNSKVWQEIYLIHHIKPVFWGTKSITGRMKKVDPTRYRSGPTH